MEKKEIVQQFTAMEREAKKEIDKGERRIEFMFGVSNEAAELARENPQYMWFIAEEAKKAIQNIAKYERQARESEME